VDGREQGAERLGLRDRRRFDLVARRLVEQERELGSARQRDRAGIPATAATGAATDRPRPASAAATSASDSSSSMPRP
jgi:hypothetical protein